MPEGPEVETIRRSIDEFVCARKVASVWRSDFSLRTPSKSSDFAFLVGGEVSRLARVGKVLWLETKENHGLFIQFGMSGKLLISRKNALVEKHTHLRMTFENSQDELRFVDPRRFGDLQPYSSQQQKNQKLSRIGPDVISINKKDQRLIVEKIRKSQRPIKVILLDQEMLSGVGNIYASEALNLAKISPLMKGAQLSVARIERILASCSKVMNEAVSNRGTTFRSYLDANGKKGDNQDHLRVFGKENEPCPNCAQSIKKLVQAGRSTFYCPVCQD